MHQMFLDMAMLVTAQGEMLNNIELNVQDSKAYMGKSIGRLEDAKKDHIAARKVVLTVQDKS